MSNKPDIKAAGDLPEASRHVVRDTILSLADSKRIIGILYAYWVLGAPELEANIAASSISQDEWGHSRILYALLKDFGDDPEKLEHSREPSEYRSIEALDARLHTWPDFVVANGIVDTALTVQLEALADSRFAPLRQRVQKQLEEERFHEAHGAAWFRRLGKAGSSARAALQDALDARWAAVLHWFGPDDFGSNEVKEGLMDATGEEMRVRFIGRIAPMVSESGLKLPEVKLDFSGWSGETRRCSDTGPDPEAVARARGDRNREFFVE
jgi:phenylacetate-CoA oxygenase PaaI subunit